MPTAQGRSSRWGIVAGCLVGLLGYTARAADLTAEVVLRAINGGSEYLKSQQRPDGSWSTDGNGGEGDYPTGVTSITLLSLLNTGSTFKDPVVRKALGKIRKSDPDKTYEVSLALMALVTAKDPTSSSDAAKIRIWAEWLEQAQHSSGGWHYGSKPFGADGSNSQFAILALHEAAEAGVPIDRQVWERARVYWETLQTPDGGFAYNPGAPGSTGSMTVAGVASLTIIEQHLRTDQGVAADGTPPCCQPDAPNPALERGLNWLANHFSVGQNPGAGLWHLYYIYGVERAGRLSGRRFFGDHAWYREGAGFLVANQSQRNSTWIGTGSHESQPTVGTALPLLFLSKGLAPVLMGKLKFGERDRARPQEVAGTDWNRHPRDVRNLAEHISGLPRWPALLTTQEVDLAKALQTTGVDALLQAPILYISGAEALTLPPEERDLLREYLLQGGFIFACPSCQSAAFEASFRTLLTEMLPPGEGELKPLTADHPVYRSEHLLNPDGVPLFGVDIGCRTAVIYAPEDLGCLWGYWRRHDPPKRNPQLKAKIIRAMQIGVNVAAYATGREPPKSLDAPKKRGELVELDDIERGLLQVAQLKHTGQWNAAPRALRNLLMALNETVGLAASPKPRDLTAADPNLFQYPLLYLHGRTRFSMSAEERKQLAEHLTRGGVLFADSCCGSTPFDRSFREVMTLLFPEHPLTPIPVTHEIFSEDVGHDVRRVRRRSLESTDPKAPIAVSVREVEPLLEGIEIDGRLVVIYSKYDISCALERQATLSCEGYIPEDAVKLATNIVLYAMQQDVRLPEAKP